MSASVLDAEADREAAQALERDLLLDDDTLAGVGEEPMTLKQGLLRGGAFTFTILLLLNSLDELENAALGILAPDIRDTFGISNGVITFITAASSAFLVLGALPMGYLADRCRRSRVVGFASLAFAVMVFCSGLAVNAFTLFLARFGVGISKANTGPVHGSLLADAYPIAVRGRMSAATMSVGTVVRVTSPLLVGVIASVAGGVEGWRWAYFILGIPVLVLAFFAFKIPEPRRGQQEMSSVLGEVLEEHQEKSVVSIEAAFARLQQIRTFRTVMIGFVALGFSLFTGGVLSNLYVEERFGLDTLERGALGTVTGLARRRHHPVRRPTIRPALPFEPRQSAATRRLADHAGLHLHPDPVPDALCVVVRRRWDHSGHLAADCVHHGRSDHHVDRPVPATWDGWCDQQPLHLLRWRNGGGVAGGAARGHHGPPGGSAHAVGSVHPHRRGAHRAKCVVHPQRHGTDRVGARRRT